MPQPSVAMIGLAVMGANLARNIERNGYPIAVYNRTWEVTEKFLGEWGGGQFSGARTLEDLVKMLRPPRQIFMMVKAGAAVDALIDSLIPLLDKGDILIDGGNTYFKDTLVREQRCAAAGIYFLGIGISGGEEGALNGPSLMPGGPRHAWEIVAPILSKISAKADGEPCTAYVGPDGAGHFVKMVHNGIEYGDMQLIAEAYDLLRVVLKCQPEELSMIFEEWNRGVLASYLVEITSKVFRKRDDQGTGFLVDKILDAAGQKGTGKWTSQVALDLGVPIPTIAAAVDARAISSLKAERSEVASEFQGPSIGGIEVERQRFVGSVHDALYCSKILAYAQGMRLIAEASAEYKWNLRLDEIAGLWRAGCIIRAKFLGEITKAYRENPALSNLLRASSMKKELVDRVGALREVVGIATRCGIPVPAFSSSLSYFDAYRTRSLPQNLTQAQRDFFGAHTFRRIDREGSFHAHWED